MRSLVDFPSSIFNSPFLPPNSYLLSVTEFCRQHCHAHRVISRERWLRKGDLPAEPLIHAGTDDLAGHDAAGA